MASTSKVVILLLVSSLAWWQASAQRSSEVTIVVGLNDLAAITNVVTTYLNRLDYDNKELFGDLILEGFKNLNNAFVQANNTLKTIPGPLSIMVSDHVLQALRSSLVVALEGLLEVLTDDRNQYNAYLGLHKKVKTALKSLKGVVVDAFGVNLRELLYRFRKEYTKNLFQEIGGKFDRAISKN